MINQLGVAHADPLSIHELSAFDFSVFDIGTRHAHILEGKMHPVPGQHGVLWRYIRIRQHNFGFQGRAADRDGGKSLRHELIQDKLGTFEFPGSDFQPGAREQDHNQGNERANRSSQKDKSSRFSYKWTLK